MTDIQNPTASASTTPTLQQKVELTEREIVFAAINDPDLAADSFELAGETFKIVNLKYKSYLKFISHIQPLAGVVTKALAQQEGIPGLDLSTMGAVTASGIMDYCGEHLPAMVALICQQTRPEITAQWVEDNAFSPFQLAGIVMQQIAQNRMISDIARFFVPLLKAMKQMKADQAKSTIKATPSS
jgi:hypothetical protein